MSTGHLFVGLGLLTASAIVAQGPMYDKVEVKLPYPVTINQTKLQPGDYVIRQHEDAGGGSRVLHFYSDRGMKLETTAMAIPALDNRSPSETKLILDHVGNDYYLNKIWIQGKDYGYEFPLPSEIRRREAGTECSGHRCRAVQGSSGADYDGTDKCDPRGGCTERSSAGGLKPAAG